MSVASRPPIATGSLDVPRAPAPSRMVQADDVKALHARSIAFSRDHVRQDIEITPLETSRTYGPGDIIKLSINPAELQYVDLMHAEMEAFIKITDTTTYNAAGDEDINELRFIPSTTQSPFAPVRGGYSVFRKVTAKQGGKTLFMQDNLHLTSSIEQTLAARGRHFDETCGYEDIDDWCSGGANGYWYDIYDGGATCSLPLSYLIDQVGMLASFNLSIPIQLELEINDVATMMGVHITPRRLASWYVAQAGQGAADTCTKIRIGGATGDTKIAFQMSEIKLVFMGLRTSDMTSLNMEPQEWAVIGAVHTSTYGPDSTSADVSIPVQKPSIKYVAAFRTPQRRTKLPQFGEINFDAGDIGNAGVPLATGGGAGVYKISTITLGIMATLLRTVPHCTGDYDMFHNWGMTESYLRMGGMQIPSGYRYQSMRRIYNLIGVTFHGKQSRGQADTPALGRLHNPNLLPLVSVPLREWGRHTTSPNLCKIHDRYFEGKLATAQILFFTNSRFPSDGEGVIGGLDSEGAMLQLHYGTSNSLATLHSDYTPTEQYYGSGGSVVDRNVTAQPMDLHFIVFHDMILRTDARTGTLSVYD